MACVHLPDVQNYATWNCRSSFVTSQIRSPLEGKLKKHSANMKKWIKILIWSVSSILTAFIIGLFCVYFWLSIKWTDFYSEKEMQTMTNEIEKSNQLPDNFYLAYDKIYPDQRNRTLAKMSFQAIWYTLTMNDNKLMNYRQCNCIWSTNFFENKVPINYHSWTSYITAHGLEKYSNEGKCFDFNYRKIGIDSLANKYFLKTLSELTMYENIELILRADKPILYEKRPDLLVKKLYEFK